MVNLEFWSAMAGVSGVFAGLLSVGLSLGLDNIRTASSELVKLNMKEQTTRLMFASTLSNLIFFVLPLIASLNLLAQSGLKTSIPFWVSMIIYLLLFLLLLRAHEKDETRRQVKSALSVNIGRSKMLLWCRFIVVKYLLYLIVLVYAGLLFAIWGGWPPGEGVLKGVAIFSLTAGLSCGIVDLSIFDINNIMFRVSDKFRGFLEDTLQRVKKEMEEVNGLYKKYQSFLKNPEYPHLLGKRRRELSGGNEEKESAIQKRIRAEQDRINSDYNRLHATLLSVPNAKDFLVFIEKDSNVSLRNVRRIKNQMELLSQEVATLKKLLNNMIYFLERLINS